MGRLLFALARWGGLRMPSEPKSLMWSDVDWRRDRLTVGSPKTARYVGHELRVISIFSEIYAPLQEVFEQVDTGQPYVLPMLRDRKAAAFRKPVMAAIKRTGLKQWPRLWQNIRATRQTEFEQVSPSYVVCTWMGNTRETARRHYLQVTDDTSKWPRAKRCSTGTQQVVEGRKKRAKPALGRKVSHLLVVK